MEELASHLQSLEEKLFEPQTRSSFDALAQLLSPEFQEIGASGRLYNFEDIIRSLRREKQQGTCRSLSDFQLRPLADRLALVIYRSVRTEPTGAKFESLRSSIWRMDDDKQWRMVFHQGTPTR